MSDYFRGDNRTGITPPDLSKDVDYADHIVKARGKRTQFTSVSKDPIKIRDFGDQLYKLKREKVDADGHILIENETLMASLREQARSQDKAAKLKAVQALRYAKKRLEGLVTWSFKIHGIERTNMITWAAGQIQPYFERQ